MKKHQCPTCKGTGKQSITMQIYGETESKSITEIDCVTCDGEGRVDDEALDLHEYEEKMWCKCGNPSGNVKYYGDGEGKWVHKHHYVCTDCGHVTQIG